MTAKGKPGIRQELTAIEEQLYSNILSVDLYQKRPYTMALVLCSHDGVQYSELGFDKYEFDNWDDTTRADIAKHKAICDIAKRIQECQMLTVRTD